MHFGEHYTVDGYNGDERLLDDESVVFSCLEKLPIDLGMHLLSEPKVYRTDGNDIKDPGGITGVVIIAESHVAVHTFPKRGFVSADVYTCKNGMDMEYIKNFIVNAFGLKDVEVNFFKRGTRYPEANIY